MAVVTTTMIKAFFPSLRCLSLNSVLALALIFAFTGCSEMQFVGEKDVVEEQDPREDIVLTNISTQITSGGLVQQVIKGKDAIFSQNRNELIIKGIQVAALGDSGEIASLTQADVGQIYFEDRPRLDIQRKDMKFAGNVFYRNPKKEDPTSDSLQMKSDLILWKEARKKFISPNGYEMLLMPKGQQPIRQSGKSFEAARDLSRFVVKAGTVTTDMFNNAEEDRADLLRQFDIIRADVEKSASQKPQVPMLIPMPPGQ